MAIIKCDICGKRMVTEKILISHMAKTHPAPEGATNPEFAPEVENPIVIEPEVSKTIILNFTKPVEISINGVHYFGKQVEVESMLVASEVVRIAKEAYGYDII